MTELQKFSYGFAGSVAIEVVKLYHLYESADSKGRKRALPPRYRRVGFWIVRLLLATIAGGLAIAYEIDRPLLAINIGVATPLILQALGQGLRTPVEPHDKKDTPE
jgi:hypothetical protein